MATFEVQVEGITGLSLDGSSSPTQDELTQFLKDGVIDVTSRVTRLRPQDIEDFTRASAEQTSNASLDINGAQIISVVREDGVTSNNWRPCRKVSLSQQYLVTDVSSLHFSSKFNPAYMIGDDSKISVFPSPGSDPNAFKVYYVNNVPVDKSGAALLYTHSDIGYFADDKVYLVVLYASIKSLQSAMSSLHGNSGISAAIALIKTAVDQAATAADKFLSATGSVFGDEDTFDTAASQLTRVKDALNNAEKIIDDGANSPTGNASGDAATYLYTEEDTELVQGALGIAATEINRAQVHLAEWTGIGGMRVKEIQSALQEAEGYAKEVQIRMADLAQEYQWYNARYEALKTEYDQAFAIMAPPQQQAQPQRRARA